LIAVAGMGMVRLRVEKRHAFSLPRRLPHGDLCIAHFLGMHALQFLPIVAYYLVRNVKMVFVVAFLYAAFTAFVFVQALRGKPFLS
jgi:NO-binding membrane sensor protein with MHYT domain